MGQYGLSPAGSPGGYPVSVPYGAMPSQVGAPRVSLSASAPAPVLPQEVKKPKKGFWSKAGALVKGASWGTVKGIVKGVVTTPINIVKRIAKNPLDLKAWGQAALIAASVIPSLIQPFALAGMAAYTAWSSVNPVMTGAKSVISGWKNNDLKQIEEGAGAVGTGTVGTALAIYGARAGFRQAAASRAGLLERAKTITGEEVKVEGMTKAELTSVPGKGIRKGGGARETIDSLSPGSQEMGAVRGLRIARENYQIYKSLKSQYGAQIKYAELFDIKPFWQHFGDDAVSGASKPGFFRGRLTKAGRAERAAAKQASSLADHSVTRILENHPVARPARTAAGQYLLENQVALEVPAKITASAITKGADHEIGNAAEALVNPYADQLVDELIAAGVPPELASDPNFVAELMAEQAGMTAPGVSPAVADPFAQLNGAGLSVGTSNPYGAGFSGFPQAAQPAPAQFNPFGAYANMPVDMTSAGFTA
ncbi:MAG: hypothetical protein AB7P76_00705 [Candidatus Melainabacteria bacterium]